MIHSTMKTKFNKIGKNRRSRKRPFFILGIYYKHKKGFSGAYAHDPKAEIGQNIFITNGAYSTYT